MNQTPAAPSPLSRVIPMLSLVASAVAIDQVIKWLVETQLPFHELVPVVPMFALYRTWNEGIAFSLLAGLPDTAPSGRLIAHLGFSLIIGGALGNLVDRAVYGHVVDYILFYTESWSFAVFNLADAFISIGAGLIVLDEVIAMLQERKHRS